MFTVSVYYSFHRKLLLLKTKVWAFIIKDIDLEKKEIEKAILQSLKKKRKNEVKIIKWSLRKRRTRLVGRILNLLKKGENVDISWDSDLNKILEYRLL